MVAAGLRHRNRSAVISSIANSHSHSHTDACAPVSAPDTDGYANALLNINPYPYPNRDSHSDSLTNACADVNANCHTRTGSHANCHTRIGSYANRNAAGTCLDPFIVRIRASCPGAFGPGQTERRRTELGSSRRRSAL